MAITSYGYGGTVTEEVTPTWARALASEYGVSGAGSWKVAPTAAARTVDVALGTGWGRSVIDIVTGTKPVVVLDSLTSGVRWDMIVARRDWSGVGGTTTFTKITGTSSETATFSTRARFDTTPGVDEQPVALVRVDGSPTGGAITQIKDLRIWPGPGGMVAVDTRVTSYLGAPGSAFLIGSDWWVRALDAAGTASWKVFPAPPAKRLWVTRNRTVRSWGDGTAGQMATVTVDGAPAGDYRIAGHALVKRTSSTVTSPSALSKELRVGSTRVGDAVQDDIDGPVWADKRHDEVYTHGGGSFAASYYITAGQHDMTVRLARITVEYLGPTS